MSWCMHPTTKVEHFVPDTSKGGQRKSLCEKAKSNAWKPDEQGKEHCPDCRAQLKAQYEQEEQKKS